MVMACHSSPLQKNPKSPLLTLPLSHASMLLSTFKQAVTLARAIWIQILTQALAILAVALTRAQAIWALALTWTQAILAQRSKNSNHRTGLQPPSARGFLRDGCRGREGNIGEVAFSRLQKEGAASSRPPFVASDWMRVEAG